MNVQKRIEKWSLWTENPRLLVFSRLNLWMSHLVMMAMISEYWIARREASFLFKEFIEQHALGVILETMILINMILTNIFLIARRRKFYEVLWVCGLSKKKQVEKEFFEFVIPYVLTWMLAIPVFYLLK